MHLNWLVWPVQHAAHSFRAYVVEPSMYKPSGHAALFRTVISRLCRPSAIEITRGTQPLIPPDAPEPFHLLTFPEAFLPADALVDFLSTLSGHPTAIGCVHVGLCATADNSASHLFPHARLRALVEQLQRLTTVVDKDFEPIRKWLELPGKSHGHFNVGCLFTIDANGRLRICLHLKNVHSRYEESLAANRHVTEACFSSLVTLRPNDKRLNSIVLQPLICSDVLELETEIPGTHPIGILTAGANGLSRRPPDHVDIVSVAACTPQTKIEEEQGNERPKWRDSFCESFERAVIQQEWRRHKHAVFTLANFLNPPDSSGGKAAPQLAGLSGVFLPTPLDPESCYEPILIDVFARTKVKKSREADWMTPEEFARRKGGNLLGYIVALKPSEISADAIVLGFTIDRLPRDASRWLRSGKLNSMQTLNIETAP